MRRAAHQAHALRQPWLGLGVICGGARRHACGRHAASCAGLRRRLAVARPRRRRRLRRQRGGRAFRGSLRECLGGGRRRRRGRAGRPLGGGGRRGGGCGHGGGGGGGGARTRLFQADAPLPRRICGRRRAAAAGAAAAAAAAPAGVSAAGSGTWRPLQRWGRGALRRAAGCSGRCTGTGRARCSSPGWCSPHARLGRRGGRARHFPHSPHFPRMPG